MIGVGVYCIFAKKYNQCSSSQYTLKYHNFALYLKWLTKEVKSMLPPDIMAATFLPLNLSSFKTAAKTVAPDTSTTIFIRSKNNLAALIISSSVTKITSRRCF